MGGLRDGATVAKSRRRDNAGAGSAQNTDPHPKSAARADATGRYDESRPAGPRGVGRVGCAGRRGLPRGISRFAARDGPA
jgi:hypothetical protein